MSEIAIEEYNADWPALFEQERDVILSAIPVSLHAIHHIGSTSVHLLSAKPIIDILIEIDDLATLDSVSGSFDLIGYEPMGEYGIRGRRFFRKGNMKRTHHIHAFERGSFGARRHLAFRDYLRAKPEVAREYESLKKLVAVQSGSDIRKYCEGKDAFVSKHQSLAIKWWKRG